MIVNISEAKAKLSQLIELVLKGEEVVITKKNLPLVELIPHTANKQRILGLLKSSFSIPADFDVEDSEIDEMFYGVE